VHAKGEIKQKKKDTYGIVSQLTVIFFSLIGANKIEQRQRESSSTDRQMPFLEQNADPDKHNITLVARNLLLVCLRCINSTCVCDVPLLRWISWWCKRPTQTILHQSFDQSRIDPYATPTKQSNLGSRIAPLMKQQQQQQKGL
jgi:hypothetical protein